MQLMKTILFCNNGINKLILRRDKKGFILDQFIYSVKFSYKEMKLVSYWEIYGAYCSTHIEDIQHEINHQTKNCRIKLI